MNGHARGDRDVELAGPGSVEVEATVAARLEPEPTGETEAIRHQEAEPGLKNWHIEHARIGNSRKVAVELVVNGIAVDRTPILADGTLRRLHFNTAIARSSWVALRIMPSGHTHPIFVDMGGKPIRASKRSASWCRACVDKLWEIKRPFMRATEQPAAAEAYDHARKTYDAILGECEIA